MNSGILILFCVVVFGLFVHSCAKDKVPECADEGCLQNSVSYSKDIVPLIQNSCATNQGPGTGCHDAWIFEYENVKGHVVSGLFMNVINDKSMPKVPNNFGIDSLTQEEIDLFNCWACVGAPNN